MIRLYFTKTVFFKFDIAALSRSELRTQEGRPTQRIRYIGEYTRLRLYTGAPLYTTGCSCCARSNLDSFAVVDVANVIALLVIVPVRVAFLILAHTPILLNVVLYRRRLRSECEREAQF